MPKEDGFALYFRDRLLSEQAVRRVDAGEGSAVYEFWWRSHAGMPKAVEVTEEAGARLEVGPDGQPLRYQFFSQGAPVKEVRFTAETVEVLLSDGTLRVIPLERPVDFVFQHNVLAQLALAVYLRKVQLPGPLVFFSPETLRTGRIEVEGGPAAWQTNLGFSIATDALGHLLGVSQPAEAGGLSGRVVKMDVPAQIDTLAERHHPPPSGGPEIDVIEEVILRNADETVRAALWVPMLRARQETVCLFLQGSGAIDRFGRSGAIDLGTIALFRALARRQLMTMSLDARGAGGTSFGPAGTNPYESRKGDALRALEWLHEHLRTREARIVLVGHSLGALLSMWLAAEAMPVAPVAMVLLAPPGHAIWRVVIDQVSDLETRTGRRTSREAKRKLLHNIRDHLRGRDTGSTTPWGLGSLLESELGRMVPSSLLVQSRIPAVACYGALDTQVPFTREGNALLAEAERAGRPLEVKVFPGLNHLFWSAHQDAPGQGPITAAQGAFDASAADWVADWIATTLAAQQET